MTASDPGRATGTLRRSLFGRTASGLAVAIAALAPPPLRAQPAPGGSDGPDWPGALNGRYHQVVDAYSINGGAPLAYAHNFVASNASNTASSVLVLRDLALAIAVNDAIWDKYKIGEVFDITDPESKAKAVKNPFLNPKHGVLRNDDGSIDKLLAAGVVVGACSLALHGMSKMAGAKIGISADDAAKEWVANVVPGITVVPSGVWGVNRAQLAGCTYCAGG